MYLQTNIATCLYVYNYLLNSTELLIFMLLFFLFFSVQYLC